MKKGTVWLALLFVFFSCSPKTNPGRLPLNSSNMEIDPSIEEDENLAVYISPFKDSVDKMMNTVIGYAEMDLSNSYSEPQTLLGNFVTDLLYTTSCSLYEHPIDFAVMNHAGGLRVPLDKGDISLRDAYEIMPFENYMWVISISGEVTNNLFKHCASTGQCTFSNASYIIDKGSPENILVNGKVILDSSQYTLVISDYLAQGGADFPLKNQYTLVYDTKVKLRDMIIDYVQEQDSKGQRIRADLDDRVKIKNQE